jgi:hypothetical protein
LGAHCQHSATLVEIEDLNIEGGADASQQVGEFGAPGTIRTSDPQIRSLMLYPAELRAHTVKAGLIATRAGHCNLFLAVLGE